MPNESWDDQLVRRALAYAIGSLQRPGSPRSDEESMFAMCKLLRRNTSTSMLVSLIIELDDLTGLHINPYADEVYSAESHAFIRNKQERVQAMRKERSKIF